MEGTTRVVFVKLSDFIPTAGVNQQNVELSVSLSGTGFDPTRKKEKWKPKITRWYTANQPLPKMTLATIKVVIIKGNYLWIV